MRWWADGDHGINMSRGFAAVEKKLPELSGKDIGTILKTVGMTLVSAVGGSAGPLYGTAFLKSGLAVAGKDEISLDDFLTWRASNTRRRSLPRKAVPAISGNGASGIRIRVRRQSLSFWKALAPACRKMQWSDWRGSNPRPQH